MWAGLFVWALSFRHPPLELPLRPRQRVFRFHRVRARYPDARSTAHPRADPSIDASQRHRFSQMVDYSLLHSLGDIESFERDADAAVMEALGDAANDLSL